ncbi:MAG: hypothetical protein AB7G93_01980 [Bdellovibrionales bacterium]
MKDKLLAIFTELNERMTAENVEREEAGAMKLRPVEVRILGQVTLLANEMAAQVLPLQMTNDLDVVIEQAQGFITKVLKEEILPRYGLELDSDSSLVWIPSGSAFEPFWDSRYVHVKLLDPESALVSKAVKAKEKNKVLIVDAIASERFPNLVRRIQENGGDLEYFAGE